MKKIFLLFASALLSLGAMANVEFTFTRGSGTSATVTAPEGVTASMETNVAWLTGNGSDMNSNTGVLCPNRNTSQASGDNFITFTLSVSGLTSGQRFSSVNFTHKAVNSGGNFQPAGSDVRHCNFTLTANGTEVASLTDQNIWIPTGSSDKVIALEGTSFAADAEGNLVIVLKISKGTSNNGCFYGLTKVELVSVSTEPEEVVHTFSADKVYYIQPQNAGTTYLTEVRGGGLSMASKDNSKYQFWRLIPVEGKSHTYYIKNEVTGKYIAQCNENATNNTQARTGTELVEYYVGITASTIADIAGCYYMASTNWENYDDEAAGPKCLNTGGGVGANVVTYTAGPNGSGGYKKNSYWRFVETTDVYQAPEPPAHTTQTKNLVVYFRPCGMVSNTYLTAATIDGVDPVSYTATAAPSSFYVPYSKDHGAVMPGSTFNVNITLNSNTDADLKANAYFDWNADGEFEATEAITLDGTAGTASVTVPEGAVSGDTRMRIRLNSNGLDRADDDVEGFVYDIPFAVVGADRKVLVDVNDTHSGTATLSSTGEAYAVGTQLTATATPKGNAEFDSWREGGVVVSRDAAYTFAVANRNMTLKAYFTENTEPEATPAQWDFTFTRTSGTEATVAVTRDGVAVEGVTATIAIAPVDNYLTAGKLAGANGDGYRNGTGILSINRNTADATEANPNKYTLTINNTNEEAFVFSYVEIYGVGVTGQGGWQSSSAPRKRYFKVKHGDTTLEPRIVSINDAQHCNGTETVNGFTANNMVVPAGATYTIELDIYNYIPSDINEEEVKGCFYGLTKIALGCVPNYSVEVEGTDDDAAGVVYNETTYADGETINATLSLTADQLEAVALDGYQASVALDKALGTIAVTYQAVVAAQWDFTFTRTSTTEATAAVTRGGVAVEGVTATIAMSTNYKTDGKLTSERTDLLCSTTNSSAATAETPIKYTLTITNNTDNIYLFDYIEVSDVALNGRGEYQGKDVNRVRNFKVTYGGTTVGPEERRICDDQHCNGADYPQGFGAKVVVPAKGTYEIVLDIYNINHDTGDNQIGSGCFYGLSKIALGNTAVSFGTTGYASLYAPIALTIPEGVTAYTGTLEEDNTWLILDAIEGGIIPKEHAVILEGEAGAKFTFEPATSAGTAVANNVLKGQTSTVATPQDGGTVYTLQSYDEDEDGVSESVIFRKYLGSKVNGGRAYLQIPEAAEAQAVYVRPRSAGEQGGSTTEIENSEFIIQNSELIFDLTGRRVEKVVEKGIYIVNGKKVVVK